MKYKIIVAVEGSFCEIDNNPSTKTKIMRNYEIEAETLEKANSIAIKLRDNLHEEAELVGEIETRFNPNVEKMA